MFRNIGYRLPPPYILPTKIWPNPHYVWRFCWFCWFDASSCLVFEHYWSLLVTKILFSYLYHLKIGFFVSKFLSLIFGVNGPNQSEDWSLKTNFRNLKNLAVCKCDGLCVFNNSPIYPGILHKLEIYFIFWGENKINV